jgi:hypothetical protein
MAVPESLFWRSSSGDSLAAGARMELGRPRATVWRVVHGTAIRVLWIPRIRALLDQVSWPTHRRGVGDTYGPWTERDATRTTAQSIDADHSISRGHETAEPAWSALVETEASVGNSPARRARATHARRTPPSRRRSQPHCA